MSATSRLGGAALGGANPTAAAQRRQNGFPPPTYPWDIPMPDYQLVQTSVLLAPGAKDPNHYPLRPEAAGWILSIEFTVIDPNMQGAAGTVEATPLLWGSTEKLVGVNWWINTTSKTANVYMPGTSVGGNAQFPKPFVYEVTRDDTLYVDFISLLTANLQGGPSFSATIVFNMKSKDPYRR